MSARRRGPLESSQGPHARSVNSRRSGYFFPQPNIVSRALFEMKRRYLQLDVFAGHPGDGNPLAVVLDAEGLDDAAMQAIAKWTRLPETTFVFPPTVPGASYRVRMFSPRREVPFAGHPSVGTAQSDVPTASPTVTKWLWPSSRMSIP